MFYLNVCRGLSSVSVLSLYFRESKGALGDWNGGH